MLARDFLLSILLAEYCLAASAKASNICCLCDEYPCKKYDGVDLLDSFITHKNQLRDLDKAKIIGLEAYKAELNRKIESLELLLSNYDDGRRKSFYCVAVNLLELQDITSAIEQITHETKAAASVKDNALIAVQVLQTMADKQDISLVLRKKQ